jgi:hypothetical protein
MLAAAGSSSGAAEASWAAGYSGRVGDRWELGAASLSPAEAVAARAAALGVRLRGRCVAVGNGDGGLRLWELAGCADLTELLLRGRAGLLPGVAPWELKQLSYGALCSLKYMADAAAPGDGPHIAPLLEVSTAAPQQGQLSFIHAYRRSPASVAAAWVVPAGTKLPVSSRPHVGQLLTSDAERLVATSGLAPSRACFGSSGAGGPAAVQVVVHSGLEDDAVSALWQRHHHHHQQQQQQQQRRRQEQQRRRQEQPPSARELNNAVAPCRLVALMLCAVSRSARGAATAVEAGPPELTQALLSRHPWLATAAWVPLAGGRVWAPVAPSVLDLLSCLFFVS